MSSCCTAEMLVAGPSDRLSVHECAVEEAQRYKWIESEKAGRDQGAWAIHCWIRQHWNGFLRERWIEHLLGQKFWIELDPDDFGVLQRAFPHSHLFDNILARIKEGDENLPLFVWAHNERLPMNEVHDILLAFDINSHRIECQLEQRLCL